MNRAPAYLLFDLDGTLVDSVPDLTLSLNLLRAELDCPPLSLEQTARMVGDGVTLLVQRALGEKLYQEAHRTRFMEIYSEHLLDQTRCYPGISALLQEHDPERMAVITNKPYQLSRQLLEGLDLTRHFHTLIGGDSLPQRKPDPLPVLTALDRLNAAAEQAVMIGDHHTDLAAGHGAGTATCFCAYGIGCANGQPSDYRVAESTDLLNLFPG